MNTASPLTDSLPSSPEFSVETLIDRLLAEQQTLTAVERFAQKHERADFPLQAKYYRNLIPLSRPAPGQQYAFEVNLDKCTGCKACVSACHSLNGLEEHETWRDVGFIVGDDEQAAYQQTVTTACHHCLDPGCLNGCPVAAYEKDKTTGIVRHLDDQCIGCQYCTMKCSYDVPKYSNRLGIVRKCDMCHERLAVNEAPACVQACPHEAIQITLVDVARVKNEALPGTRMLPGAFDSSYTVPTTRYISKRPIPEEAWSASASRLHLEHAHWPLIIMLLLSQMSVGVFIVVAATGIVSPVLFRSINFPATLAGFIALNAGLASSTLHLGRPMGAWRFFLGLRTSWMSREILAFSVFAAVSSLCPAAAWYLPGSAISVALTMTASLIGIMAVFTSVMIYVDTQRDFWSLSRTFTKFFGATTLLGLLTTGVIASRIDCAAVIPAASSSHYLFLAATAVNGALFIWELVNYHRAVNNVASSWHRSARTIRHLLPWIIPTRGACQAASIFFLSMTQTSTPCGAAILASAALVICFLSLVLERYTFFTAVTAHRMPGGI
jgi:Fe-S-cluster-containing dehydrogenase component/DMSO reductase anchor subunit